MSEITHVLKEQRADGDLTWCGEILPPASALVLAFTKDDIKSATCEVCAAIAGTNRRTELVARYVGNLAMIPIDISCMLVGSEI